MENAKKFFEELIKTDEAKALIASIKAPETEEARIAAYVDIANKLGVELTVDEAKEYLSTVIEAAASEIDDTELSHLVGGREACADTYKNRENCWINDACDYANNTYTNYSCAWSNKGACLIFNVNENKRSDGRPRKFG